MCGRSGTVIEKNWALSVDQCQLQALQFSVHLIYLLSILLRCNGFWQDSENSSGSDQQQPTEQWPWLFLWCRFGLGKCFGASSWSSHQAGHRQLSYTIHFLLHMTIQLRNGLLLLHRVREDDTEMIFFFFSRLMRHPLTEVFYVSSLLQVLNDCRIVNAEFFINSHVVVRGSALMITLNWSFSTSNGQPLLLLIFKALITFAKLEPPLHYTFISSSWAKYIVDIASCIHWFTTHF